MKRSIHQMQMEGVCRDMIKAFSGDRIPEQIDIDSFVNEYLGYAIVYENFANRNKQGFTSDGTYPLEVIRDGVKRKVVFPPRTIVIDKYYQSKEREEQRRFILAHEAGHIVDSIVEGTTASGFLTDDSDGYANSSFLDIQQGMALKEITANKYGAALLMPDYVIGNLLRKYHDGKKFFVYNQCQFSPSDRQCLKKLTKILNVSYSALFYRLKDLGVFVECEDTSYLSKLNIGGNNDG